MQYVVYARAESGTIARAHDRVSLDKSARAANYPHAERLQGWPERTVYWSRPTGPAAGIAPLQR